MASFQAKVGWKRPRKRENKNFHSVPFRSYPMGNKKSKKREKKNKKYHSGFISSQNRLEKVEKERK